MKKKLALLAMIALLASGVFLWRARTTTPKLRQTHSVLGYPQGVWPGRVQPFGDRFVEARAGRAGSVRLFFMAGEERVFTPIDAAVLEGEVISANGDATPLKLYPEPIKGFSGQGSWRYQGQAPMERVQPNKWGLYGLRVTVPYKSVNHSVVWKPEQTTALIDTRDSGGAVMPAAPSNEEERKLFLEPGGKYTAADIAANGNAIASVRYRGIMAAHTIKPKAGTLICPITQTLANPKFTWIVDGKTYRFCCPPCIAEFVRQAKEKPQTIHPPDFYKAG